MNIHDSVSEHTYTILTTPRLILKAYTAKAAQEVFIRNDERYAMQAFALHNTEDLHRFRITVFSCNEYRSCMLFTIQEQEDSEVIGSCNFHIWMPKHFRAEIGYGISEQFHNKGIMKETMNAVLSYGFEQMDLNRIEAFISAQNIPSLKLVNHFGFTNEGVMRGHYYKNDRFEDSLCFSLLRSEYEALKQSW